MHTTLVLGGYGFFGTRICRALAAQKNIRLLIAGRDSQQAQALAHELGLQAEQGLAIDAQSADLPTRLAELEVNTVIHTAGPFQGQNYAVAKAAIAAGANYIDLADGREFVVGISQLDAAARSQGVLVTSGASSLPALSSAVVDRYLNQFKRLDTIQHGIGSGARAPGLATMRGVFGYCGKSFMRLKDGEWQSTVGWLDTIRYRFPSPVGARLLGSCDVPDLTLFPLRYPSVKTVIFRAGFASPLGHVFVWCAAQLVRLGFIANLNALVRPLHQISHWMEPLVSDKGGMFVSMSGEDMNEKPLTLVWHLIAGKNHGPEIPCGAAIALAKKLACGDIPTTGAVPCMGLLTVEDYLDALAPFDVRELPA
jgi:saccharopine dehydrogenase-like NADP-dependent oxidoreductase